MRVAVLADLHLGEVSGFHERIAEAVADADVDLIVIVGDAIDRADRLPVLTEFLGLLPTGPRRLATLGNWEYWSGVDRVALRRTYEAAGARLLVNLAGMLMAWPAGLVTASDPEAGGAEARPAQATPLLTAVGVGTLLASL